MSERVPVEVLPPGDLIREELQERGWTQADLARILGRPLSVLNQIITGKRSITPATARELAAAFGTSAKFWLNLEAAYRLFTTKEPDNAIRRRAHLYEIAPIKNMERRHWIRKTKSAATLERELKRFFGVESLDEPPHLQLAARTNVRSGEEITAAQWAWCRRAAWLATLVQAARFTKSAFRNGREQLRGLMAHPEGVRKLPSVLAQMGIRLVVVQHLPKTRIDGVALWIGAKGDCPVIALSVRFDRIDWFWHTVCHEVSHILNHDDYALDIDLVARRPDSKTTRSEIEERADAEAADFVIPSSKLSSLVMRVKPYYSKKRIVQFAHTVGVHPGLVVGQLQFRKEVPYSANREMLVKVRHLLIETAITDGWGKVVSLRRRDD